MRERLVIGGLCLFLLGSGPLWAQTGEALDRVIAEAVIKAEKDLQDAKAMLEDARRELHLEQQKEAKDQQDIAGKQEKVKKIQDKVEASKDELENLCRRAYRMAPQEAVEKAKTTIGLLTLAGGDKEEVRLAARSLLEASSQGLIDRAQLEEDLEKRFRGFGFGIALGAVIDTGRRDRIGSAIVDANGIVRVERDNNTRANFMLESHYFFTPDWSFPFGPCTKWLDWVKQGDWGWGPFVAIQPGSNNIIDSVGAGWMVGFKRPRSSGGSAPLGVGDSFNLGIGMILDLKQRVLGDGIQANQALPTGETVLRYKETSQAGLLITFSYSFY